VQLDELLGPARARRLRDLIRGALVDAYTENCNRYSEDLGDNNLTFAVSVIHNLRHMVDEALEFEVGVCITRPRGSFQVEVDGRFVFHFYKVPSGAGDVGEKVRFDQSRTKIELLTENTEQLSLTFEDAPPAYRAEHARQLVILHSGTPGQGLKDVWVGAPYHSAVNGLSWAWLEEFANEGRAPLVEQVDQLREWANDSEIPDLVVRLRTPAQLERADGSVSP
jgi:hypothetical protein